MAKRRLLQWMRDRLTEHADKVVIPAAEKKILDAAYKKAMPRIVAVVEKKFPPNEMKILKKWKSASACTKVSMQFPNGVVAEFKIEEADRPLRPSEYEYRSQMYLVDEATAKLVDAWLSASEVYETERKKRLQAYKAIVLNASTVEDLIEVWPEAKGILPEGSPPVALSPEQYAIVKADQRERKAA